MIPFDGQNDRVEVTFAGKFGGYNSDSFTIDRKISFDKSAELQKFQFDDRNSQVSKSMFSAIYDIADGTLTNEAFLEFAYDSLLTFAQRRNDEGFLRELLSNVDDSPQKRELMRLLARKAASGQRQN